MQIDRSNYEIWIIDWLDGNLNDLQISQLNLFLKDNPDIRDEFEELPSLTVEPSSNHYQHKENLKKSLSEISPSQFEYISTAYLEGDLSSDQKGELSKIIENDPEKRKIFDTIQKTRLVPQKIVYSYKKRLIRLTLTQKVIRFSAIGLSAAALVAFIVATYITAPSAQITRPVMTSRNNVAEKDSTPLTIEKAAALKEIPKVQARKQVTPKKELPAIAMKEETAPEKEQDIYTKREAVTEISLKKIPVRVKSDLAMINQSNILITSSLPHVSYDFEEGRSNVGRFLARTFREKILKDKTTSDTPIRAYEIAEAGVSGLNKLLGWQMALNENKDDNGNLKSVYFNSRILKFNAPVKKHEPAP
jgi:hypothetical protein